jgi:hypothetical protein
LKRLLVGGVKLGDFGELAMARAAEQETLLLRERERWGGLAGGEGVF